MASHPVLRCILYSLLSFFLSFFLTSVFFFSRHTTFQHCYLHSHSLSFLFPLLLAAWSKFQPTEQHTHKHQVQRILPTMGSGAGDLIKVLLKNFDVLAGYVFALCFSSSSKHKHTSMLQTRINCYNEIRLTSKSTLSATAKKTVHNMLHIELE